MLVKLINSIVLHAITILYRTKVQAVFAGLTLSLMGEDLFVSTVFHRAGFLVFEDAFNLHVLLNDVVDVPVQ